MIIELEFAMISEMDDYRIITGSKFRNGSL
jgi:hypothetical protein